MRYLLLSVLLLLSACGQVTEVPDDASPDTVVLRSPPPAAPPPLKPDGGPSESHAGEVHEVFPSDAGTDSLEVEWPVCDIRFECKVEGPLNHCRCPDGGV